MFKSPYGKETEDQMKGVFDSLNERDRRRYAAIEAKKLPHGGIRYLSRILGCTPNTIHRGLSELLGPLLPNPDRIRQEGGGRKKSLEKMEGLEEAFLEVLKEHTAGDPMNEQILWTDLSLKEIISELLTNGFRVGKYIVKQLLRKHGYVKRKASKSQPIGSCENRDEQFNNIAGLKEEYRQAGNPIISIDTKKKSGWATFTVMEDYILKS